MPIFVKDGKLVNFIHIPKCAGTSVEKTLQDYCDGFLLHTGKVGILPCTPQHFHADVLPMVIKGHKAVPSFAIVRHPLLRMISEYFWRNRKSQSEGSKLREPNQHIVELIKNYNINEFAHDNHIRHQVAFMLENTKVFKLETGIDESIMYAFDALGINTAVNTKNSNHSKSTDIKLSSETIKFVEDFYQVDYDYFGYERVKLDKDFYSYSELKQFVKDSTHKNDVDYNAEIISKYRGEQKRNQVKRAECLRDEALKLEKVSVEAAYYLMLEASKLKPNGKVISQKLYEYKTQLIAK